MPGKILAVDDDPDQLEVLDLLLTPSGFTVDTAANGLEALDKVARCRPDLIVLDVSMPKMNGFAVCEQLQADPATAAIPILMLTGFHGHFAELNGLAHGASAYLTKPYKPAELIATVRQLLREPAPPRPSPP